MLLLLKQQRSRVLTLLVAVIGGILANVLNIPLPWTIGPLIAVIALNILGAQVTVIPRGRSVGQFVIGISLGLYFMPPVVLMIMNQWLLLLLGALSCIAISLLMVWLNRRIHTSNATVFFACTPGGASEMVNLGRQFGADPAFVASAHTLRVVLLVLIVPVMVSYLHQGELNGVSSMPRVINFWVLMRALPFALLGVMIWRRLKQPNPWVLGSLFSTAIITYLGNGYSQVPATLLAVAQLLLAVSLAAPINRGFFYQAPKFILHIIGTTLLSFLLTFGLSLLFAYLFQQNYLTLYLGMMSGGVSELSLTASALNLNVAIVSSMQTLRFIMVILLAQSIFSLFYKK